MPWDQAAPVRIARRAGVSRSAIGRTSNPRCRSLRRQARDAGPSARLPARPVIAGRSRVVGRVLACLDDAAAPRPPSAAASSPGPPRARPRRATCGEAMQKRLDHRVEGIVPVSASMSSSRAARRDDRAVPVVLFDRDRGEAGMCAVTTPAPGGPAVATAAPAPSRASRAARRSATAGAARGGRGDAALARDGGFDRARARAAALGMLARPDRAEAVFGRATLRPSPRWTRGAASPTGASRGTRPSCTSKTCRSRPGAPTARPPAADLSTA